MSVYVEPGIILSLSFKLVLIDCIIFESSK